MNSVIAYALELGRARLLAKNARERMLDCVQTRDKYYYLFWKDSLAFWSEHCKTQINWIRSYVNHST